MDHLLLKRFKSLPFPNGISQCDQEVFLWQFFPIPRSMGPCEPSKLWLNSDAFKDRRPVDLVLTAWTS
ncbi:hypothetical protein HOV93_38660 [Planctomycetes bacterium FF15]|uniref:Uncharacterized protein n=1 Tax=Bremerella alba TaxID=980252 RepID=A0A7V8V829_9BACT|nr:hypothetical protein [Bremerella alba]